MTAGTSLFMQTAATAPSACGGDPTFTTPGFFSRAAREAALTGDDNPAGYSVEQVKTQIGGACNTGKVASHGERRTEAGLVGFEALSRHEVERMSAGTYIFERFGG